MGSHSLLLRLFQSYFSVHVALQYLRLYSDNIGITYYITRRLRQLDTEELADVWGFIWYPFSPPFSLALVLKCTTVISWSPGPRNLALLSVSWLISAQGQLILP